MNLLDGMATSLSVIIVATAAQAEALLLVLRQGGFEPRWERADSLDGLGRALARPGWDLVLATDDMAGLGLEPLLSLAGAQSPRLPILVAASRADAAATRAALRAGAADVIWPAHLDRLALAVERALLPDRRMREHEVDLVQTFAAALRSVTTRAAMLPVIAEQIQQIAGASAVALFLPEVGSGEWAVAAGHGWPDPVGTPLRPDDLPSRAMAGGLAEWLVVEPQVGLAQPHAADPGGSRYFALATPLLIHGQAIGAIGIHSDRAPREPQLRLLSVIAEMAASALQRATLHEQTEQRVQRLAALHAIDVAITASFDLRVTLGVFLDHAIAQLRVDAAAVVLLNNATQTLVYGATRGFNTQPARSVRMPMRLGDSLPGQVVSLSRPLHVSNLSEMRLPGVRPYPPGETHFSSYYGVPLQVKGRVQGVLEVLHGGRLPADAEWIEYLDSLATQAAIAIDNASLFSDLQRSNAELSLAYEATIEGWARVLEARGVESSDHTRRVADLALKLARAAGLVTNELIHVRRGALLHDIGMLAIPEQVALKPGPLSEAERAIVQHHPEFGFEILAPIVYLRPSLDIPYCHHESWDGSGYPRGMRGEQIPLAARLFTVVDNWDALRSDRPYRAAWSTAAAVDFIRSNAGKRFDPELVALFLQDGIHNEAGGQA